MKKFCWFTHTNISSKDPIDAFYFMDAKQHPDLSYDLSKYLPIFLDNEIWTKKGYREEYTQKFNRDDLEKIKSIKFHFHCKGGPFSNSHEYERVLSSYIDLNKVEHSKIVSSGISRASKIAVIEVEFNSENKIIDYLSYEEEKDLDTIFEKKLTSENIDAWHELNAIKAIICEFIQFFNFNLHLNYQTHSYEFSFSDKPNLIGFTTVEENGKLYYETDQIDFFAHYILHEKLSDNLAALMDLSVKFWHKETTSIHFFLDALKGDNITGTNFIKLVFTLESFFGKNTSNDFMSLTIPLLIDRNVATMKAIRETLKNSFSLRNNIVHGGEVYSIHDKIRKQNQTTTLSKLFFEMKNLITHLFYFYINNQLDLREKINHEMIFKFFPDGIKRKI